MNLPVSCPSPIHSEITPIITVARQSHSNVKSRIQILKSIASVIFEIYLTSFHPVCRRLKESLIIVTIHIRCKGIKIAAIGPSITDSNIS